MKANKPAQLGVAGRRRGLHTLLVAGAAMLGVVWSGAALAASKKTVPVTPPSPSPITIVAPVTPPSPSPISIVAPVPSVVQAPVSLNAPLGGVVSQAGSALLLDPSKLGLKTASDASVYFMGGSAEFQKTLGVKSDGTGGSALLFPDASSVLSKYLSSGGGSLASSDFVNVGNLDAGAALDFLLGSSGASKGQLKSFDKQLVDSGALKQVVASAYALKDSPYLIVGFKNLLGDESGLLGGLQYSVDVGSGTIQALTATPEPSTWAMLGGLVLVVGWFRRNRASAPANV